MLIKIIDNRNIYLDNLTAHEEELVKKHFSVALPSRRYLDSMWWDGVIRKYDQRNQTLNRAFLIELKSMLDKKNIPYSVVDERPPTQYPPLPKEQITNKLFDSITLDEHQVRALQVSADEEIGIVAIPVGGGKGEIAAGLCKVIQCPTAILADQLIVVDQLKKRLELREVASEVGVFYAGKTPADQMILVGSVQSLCVHKQPTPPKPVTLMGTEEEQELQRAEYVKEVTKYEKRLRAWKSRGKRAKMLRALVSKCDMLITDECDRTSSKQYQSVYKHWFNGRRRYGLSGTPYDDNKPVERLHIMEAVGSVIATETKEKLVEIGRTVPLEYYMVVCGDEALKNERSALDIAYAERVVENPDFHNLIRTIATTLTKTRTLILVDRDILGKRLEEIIEGSRFIHGKTRPQNRNDALRSFERGDFNILIGGKILARGLDLLGGCENLIITTGGKQISELQQKMGRGVRLNKIGKCRVFDIFHLSNRYLYAHSRLRLKAVVAANYPATVIYGQTRISGEDFIKRRFRRPRQLS